jgi:hypothetical protein
MREVNYRMYRTKIGQGTLASTNQPLGFRAGRPLEAFSSCGTGQTDATPDSPVPYDFAALTLPLTVHHGRRFCSWPLARASRCSAGSPDSPVAYWIVRWIIAECTLEFLRVAGLELYGHGAPDTIWWHTGQSGAPFFSTLKFFCSN